MPELASLAPAADTFNAGAQDWQQQLKSSAPHQRKKAQAKPKEDSRAAQAPKTQARAQATTVRDHGVVVQGVVALEADDAQAGGLAHERSETRAVGADDAGVGDHRQAAGPAEQRDGPAGPQTGTSGSLSSAIPFFSIWISASGLLLESIILVLLSR